MLSNKKIVVLLICAFFTFEALAVSSESAQLIQTESSIIASKIQQTNGSTRMLCSSGLRCSLSLTSQFYITRNYQPVWTLNNAVTPEAKQVIQILANSYQDGLNPTDFHITQLELLLSQITNTLKQNQIPHPQLLADFDTTLSDAYLIYSKQMAFGKVDTYKYYPDWKVAKRSLNIETLFVNAAKNNELVKNLHNLTPSYPGYAKLKAQLSKYQQIAQDGGWKIIPQGTVLRNGSKGSRVVLLANRLAKTDDSELANANDFDNTMKLAVKKFQSENNLKVTGVVDTNTLQSLNIPVTTRIKQIQFNLDRMRWLPSELGNPYLIVNIPNYSLSIIRDGQVQLYMPVIVGGGGDNKTCVVNSEINNLELNPYWGIPFRIATKEYLKKIQESSDYLGEHNIRVFTKNNQEVDPNTINWQKMNADNFNYFLRQDPGKKNALGKVKFLFNNDCGIYLHDTSNPKLFAKYSRSLSHGCVRVGEPIALADYLIESNANWSTKGLETAIATGKHRWVKITQPLPIHIVYLTAWVDNQNNLQFRKDIYKTESVDFPVYLPKISQFESN